MFRLEDVYEIFLNHVSVKQKHKYAMFVRVSLSMCTVSVLFVFGFVFGYLKKCSYSYWGEKNRSGHTD